MSIFLKLRPYFGVCVHFFVVFWACVHVSKLDKSLKFPWTFWHWPKVDGTLWTLHLDKTIFFWTLSPFFLDFGIFFLDFWFDNTVTLVHSGEVKLVTTKDAKRPWAHRKTKTLMVPEA